MLPESNNMYLSGVRVDKNKLESSQLFTDLINTYPDLESIDIPERYGITVVTNYVSWLNSNNTSNDDNSNNTVTITSDNVRDHVLFGAYIQDDKFLMSLTKYIRDANTLTLLISYIQYDDVLVSLVQDILKYCWPQFKLVIKGLSNDLKNKIYAQVPYMLVIELESMQNITDTHIANWFKSIGDAQSQTVFVGTNEYVIKKDYAYKYASCSHGRTLVTTINGVRHSLLIGLFYSNMFSDNLWFVMNHASNNCNYGGNSNNDDGSGSYCYNITLTPAADIYIKYWRVRTKVATECIYDMQTKLTTVTSQTSDRIITVQRYCPIAITLYFTEGFCSYKHGTETHYSVGSATSFDVGTYASSGVIDNNINSRTKNKLLEVDYVKGNKHGAETTWYEDGVTVESVTTYWHGWKHWICQKWNSRGRLRLSSTYVKGRLHGPSIEFYDDDDDVNNVSVNPSDNVNNRCVVKSVDNFQHGVRHGLQQYNYPTGHISHEVNYLLGLKHGLERFYEDVVIDVNGDGDGNNVDDDGDGNTNNSGGDDNFNSPYITVHGRLTEESFYRRDVLLRHTKF